MYGEARARGKVVQVGELYTALALHIVCVFGAWHLAKVLNRRKEQTNGTQEQQGNTRIFFKKKTWETNRQKEKFLKKETAPAEPEKARHAPGCECGFGCGSGARASSRCRASDGDGAVGAGASADGGSRG